MHLVLTAKLLNLVNEFGDAAVAIFSSLSGWVPSPSGHHTFFGLEYKFVFIVGNFAANRVYWKRRARTADTHTRTRTVMEKTGTDGKNRHLWKTRAVMVGTVTYGKDWHFWKRLRIR